MYITYLGSNDTIPNAPLQISPADNFPCVDTTAPLFLKWAAVSDGIIYHAELSTDPTFATLTDSLNTSNLTWLVNNLMGNTTYYWRVKVNNGGQFSAYSTTYSFYTTCVFTGIATAKEAKNAAVFPNPSQNKFTFSDLEKGNRLELFDTNGKLIQETLLKDNTLTIDLEGKEKGIYLYRIMDAQQEVHKGKLILR
jgi:hypothetical protein